MEAVPGECGKWVRGEGRSLPARERGKKGGVTVRQGRGGAVWLARARRWKSDLKNGTSIFNAFKLNAQFYSFSRNPLQS